MAIQAAADKFGNGQTLPFTPCKRGYIPIVKGERKYACHLHNDLRKARVCISDGGKELQKLQFRSGEKDLRDFWNIEKMESPRIPKKRKKESVDKQQLIPIHLKDEEHVNVKKVVAQELSE